MPIVPKIATNSYKIAPQSYSEGFTKAATFLDLFVISKHSQSTTNISYEQQNGCFYTLTQLIPRMTLLSVIIKMKIERKALKNNSKTFSQEVIQ